MLRVQAGGSLELENAEIIVESVMGLTTVMAGEREVLVANTHEQRANRTHLLMSLDFGGTWRRASFDEPGDVGDVHDVWWHYGVQRIGDDTIAVLRRNASANVGDVGTSLFLANASTPFALVKRLDGVRVLRDDPLHSVAELYSAVDNVLIASAVADDVTMVTRDLGSTWVPASDQHARLLDIYATGNGGVMLARVDERTGSAGMWVSIDRADTWISLVNGTRLTYEVVANGALLLFGYVGEDTE